MFRSRLLLVLAATGWLVGLVACEHPRTVAVRVSIPGPDSVDTPVTGIGLVALPYDRDSVLAALARNARSPRPDTAELQRGPELGHGPGHSDQVGPGLHQGPVRHSMRCVGLLGSARVVLTRA